MVEDNSEHEKAKSVTRNVVAAISHNEYKDVLLNNKCVRHSMNRIQSKDCRIGANEIKKTHCLVLITKYISRTMDMAD